MSNNDGKFIDRNPNICAAGKSFRNLENSVADCLKNYSLQNAVDSVINISNISKDLSFKYKPLSLKNYRHAGIYSESRSCLRPEVQSRYQTLINDLKETCYESYWNKTDKPKDALPNLPAGMDYKNTSFGKKTERSLPAKDVVNPTKTIYEVLWDSQVGHDNYIKSHNDYNPSETKNRKYFKPAFQPNKRYGCTFINDPRGIWVRCVCRWCNSNYINSVNSIQADTATRLQSYLGNVFAPVKNIESVSKGHMFGKFFGRDYYGVGELLKDGNVKPCVFKRDFFLWMSYLNQLRIYLKKRVNKLQFNFLDFENYILHYDIDLSGWIPLHRFYDICKCYGVKYEYSSLEPLFKMCGVIREANINYKDFIYLADINKSVPEIIKIEDVPEGNKYYVSINQSVNIDILAIDSKKKNYSKLKPAGVPSIRYDRLYPVIPLRGCRADLENFGDETTVKGVLSPSIYSNYGLTYRDFYMPRSSEIIKKIFEKIGYQFPGDTFKKLWQIAIERDKTGFVCVNTFKILLNEVVPALQLIVEDPCY